MLDMHPWRAEERTVVTSEAWIDCYYRTPLLHMRRLLVAALSAPYASLRRFCLPKSGNQEAQTISHRWQRRAWCVPERRNSKNTRIGCPASGGWLIQHPRGNTPAEFSCFTVSNLPTPSPSGRGIFLLEADHEKATTRRQLQRLPVPIRDCPARTRTPYAIRTVHATRALPRRARCGLRKIGRAHV